MTSVVDTQVNFETLRKPVRKMSLQLKREVKAEI